MGRDDDVYILGTTVLKTYYTVFDAEKMRVGFAYTADEKEPPSRAGPVVAVLYRLTSLALYVVILVCLIKISNDSKKGEEEEEGEEGEGGRERGVEGEEKVEVEVAGEGWERRMGGRAGEGGESWMSRMRAHLSKLLLRRGGIEGGSDGGSTSSPLMEGQEQEGPKEGGVDGQRDGYCGNLRHSRCVADTSFSAGCSSRGGSCNNSSTRSAEGEMEGVMRWWWSGSADGESSSSTGGYGIGGGGGGGLSARRGRYEYLSPLQSNSFVPSKENGEGGAGGGGGGGRAGSGGHETVLLEDHSHWYLHPLSPHTSPSRRKRGGGTKVQ